VFEILVLPVVPLVGVKYQAPHACLNATQIAQVQRGNSSTFDYCGSCCLHTPSSFTRFPFTCNKYFIFCLSQKKKDPQQYYTTTLGPHRKLSCPKKRTALLLFPHSRNVASHRSKRFLNGLVQSPAPGVPPTVPIKSHRFSWKRCPNSGTTRMDCFGKPMIGGRGTMMI
jgi:hypothetical protein